jgi:hypothetical protein
MYVCYRENAMPSANVQQYMTTVSQPGQYRASSLHPIFRDPITTPKSASPSFLSRALKAGAEP